MKKDEFTKQFLERLNNMDDEPLKQTFITLREEWGKFDNIIIYDDDKKESYEEKELLKVLSSPYSIMYTLSDGRKISRERAVKLMLIIIVKKNEMGDKLLNLTINLGMAFINRVDYQKGDMEHATGYIFEEVERVRKENDFYRKEFMKVIKTLSKEPEIETLSNGIRPPPAPTIKEEEPEQEEEWGTENEQ